MTQSALKLIALLSMLLDHTAKTVLTTGILIPVIGMEANRMIRVFMVSVGRMAFPVFAWFAAEGCRKSSDPTARLIRLGVFSILSEIPFQLCFDKSLSLGCHNVNFTILLAAAAIWMGNLLAERRVPAPWAQLFPAILDTALGWFLHTDYNAWGVALILGLYYLPTEQGRLLLLTVWVTVFQLIWHGWNGRAFTWLHSDGRLQVLYWLGALTAAALLATYNGQRGRGSKWLYYWFYPSHLLILYGLTVLFT